VEYCKIHGRTDLSQPAIPLFWNGSGIELNVSGSELWLDIEVDFDLFEPWVSVELNGAFMSRQMLLPGRQLFCLFRCMNPEEKKTVFFRRELQAMHEDDACHLVVHGVLSDGAFYPVKERRYKLEFVGDSITSGEGTYGAKSDVDWLSMYMSSSINYATMIGRELDAEVRLISQGGFGVYTGWDNDVRHNMPAFYDPICGLAFGETNEKLGAMKPYDFSSWPPDAVIVNLGTNDDSAFHQPPFTDPETGAVNKMRENTEDVRKVQDAVIKFLRHLREKNPASHIVWTYGMIRYALSLPISEAVSSYIRESGDTNVFYLQLPDTAEDDLGAHAHPGPRAHVRAAEILCQYLSNVLKHI
ncbi:MAG: GDSL family lipase, partial [Lachnospiraceae bacterium]|nr:GDSL family lipase [Lachnospiraceae bacterium]